MIRALIWLGARGQYCLIAGLLAGLLMPATAAALEPWIGVLITALLIVTGMRVGARAAFGGMGSLRPALVRVVILQLLLPLIAFAALSALGWQDTPLGLALCLMLAAPSVTGAPNFAIMAGQDPAPGMRLLVLGTALFPLTALPLMVLLNPQGTGVLGALSLSLGLLAAVFGAVGLGFLLRRWRPILRAPKPQATLDGLAAVLLGVVVVGLMSAIGPLAREAPMTLLIWGLAVMAINFGLVLITWQITRGIGASIPAATAIYAGNRNIALFLIVLPSELTAALMIFIGCYQVPMYLTPFLLSRMVSKEGPRNI